MANLCNTHVLAASGRLRHIPWRQLMGDVLVFAPAPWVRRWRVAILPHGSGASAGPQ